ncbi:carbapenem antibiotics biosynthesis protein carD [Verticillium dahliae VdLs.17]|uniref:Proline dehydrogenase n=1 Tax=Verticillium dahliae (strain VdLs.17 / ATCC MYA-4575 / FGSC 10137) TaxID=498257 RepID=G2X8S4_VERDV|nr:carbapenem antibiotics biosynthesis protein carD [Verticillium dahliae VdLs.17]EGY15361.1 carbapenem antibiotics biosynthesis protein carD [Verticillium dahliae VdLs.17]KAH6698014.1 carbapenem antibiotics biosynthesis protein card [Verticillium dahliae]
MLLSFRLAKLSRSKWTRPGTSGNIFHHAATRRNCAVDSHRDASLIHTSSKNSYHPKVHLHPAAPPANPAAVTPAPAHRAPLSLLPLHMILRSLLTTTISSSRWLLPPSLAIASALAHATHPLLSPDRNPLLRVLLKHTFYAQFCAGETPAEVRRTVSRLKGLGFSGVILGYAREVVMTEAQTRGLSGASETSRRSDEEEVRPWQEGTEQTQQRTDRVRFTGAGQQALYALSERFPPSAALASAMDSICACAAARGVRLLFDAEQAAVQQGIDDWTLTYQRKYNTVPGRAVIYGTYQAYLKSTPATLTRHLLTAQEQGFTLGVKLVRGAYLGSDPRHLINDTKDETDAAYDDMAEGMLRQQWGGRLRASGSFPPVSLVVASHNVDSVRRARALVETGQARIEFAFGQLQGMADEVSCALVMAANDRGLEGASSGSKKAMETYKYLVWGSTGECMKYLLRRAHENRDAVQRTRTGRDAMRAEIARRARSAVGLET